MSDSRPIGVFDSGVGGLTVLLTLQRRLPAESTIYVGDLARCPYGPRPQEQVREFALQVGDFLADQGIKLLVVACNTATAAAYSELCDRYPFPVVGVIAPGAAEATRATRNGRIGVVATDGTVASGAYSDAIHRCMPEAQVFERAASWLVPLIERGDALDHEIEHRIAPMVDELQSCGTDTLILGCTHFPLVEHLFRRAAGDTMTILDSATTTAREVAHLIAEFGIEGAGVPTHRFLVTGSSHAFALRAQTMFHASPPIETVDFETTPWINSL